MKMIQNIVGGLAVVGIVWLLKLLWSYGKLLLDHLSYSSVKIEGMWKTELGTDAYTESVDLKRFGYRVWGTITCVSSPNNVDNGKIYKFSGSFKDRILVASYQPKDDSGFIDPGTLLLELVDGKRTLRGHTLLYHHAKNRLETWKYTWTKP
jgi:hypothetical protein